MDKIKVTQEIEVKGNYDVIVAGGGVAGAAAAVSARRMGKSVLLIEKTVCLGGLATIGLVNLFVPMCNGRGTQIIKGMAEEFLRLSIRHGFDTIPEDWKSGEPGEGNTKQRYLTRFSAPIFAMELTKLLKDEGVDILFDTVVSRPVTDKNRILGLITENKSGTECYTGNVIIDTTGDADVLFRAGVPTVQGGNYDTFYMFGADTATCKKAYDGSDLAMLPKFITVAPADLYGNNQPEGKPLWTGTTGENVSEYITEKHIEAIDKIKDDNRSERDVLLIPTMPQFRTTRHIDGDVTFTENDAYKHREDSIGAICDFDRRDYLFEIPYGTLVKQGWKNIITAGRSASASGYGWDILRVIPPAIITGQAAGIAAALSIDSGCDIADVDIAGLQKILSEQGVDIHFDDGLIPEDINAAGERFESDHI